MRKIQRITLWIILGTVGFIIFFISAVVKIYDLTLNDAKYNHQLQQMEMAKAAKTGIINHLDHLVEDLHFLTPLPGIRELDENVAPEYIYSIFKHYQKNIVKAVYVSDIDAQIIYSVGDSLPDWLVPLLKQKLASKMQQKTRVDCLYSKVKPNDKNNNEKGLSFLILVPIYSENRDTDNMQMLGSVGYLVNFNALIQQYISALELRESDFAWIMDGNGTLIYHPRHEEMLLRTIQSKKNTECLACHQSFKTQNKMLIEGASIGEYKIGNEPIKIMAHVPINLGCEKWILVISTFLPKVTASLRDKFQLFFMLGIVILIVFTLFSLLLYYANARRIRAEEAKRQSEQMHQLQEQLSQASKLASIGELVDTVAHEINTPTGIIAAHADALLLQPDQKNICADEMLVIKKQTRRIHDYTKSLLGYSKRISLNPQPTCIKSIIEECVYMLGHRFRARQISVKQNYSPSLPKILIDHGQIEQVFINLLNNAVDAIEGPGLITIDVLKVGGEYDPEREFSGHGISIQIKDNGSGIKSADIDKIFKPFFSTKPPGQGTGLGLYISKSIIERYKGTIKVSSDSDTGTAFKIILPLIL